MGDKIERLSEKVELTRIFIPPYVRVREGQVEHVDSHWREIDDWNDLDDDEKAAVARQASGITPARRTPETPEEARIDALKVKQADLIDRFAKRQAEKAAFRKSAEEIMPDGLPRVTEDTVANPGWEYEDARGNKKRGVVENTVDRGGTDVTYFMRSESGDLDLLRGELLKKAHTTGGLVRVPRQDVQAAQRAAVQEPGAEVTIRTRGMEHLSEQATVLRVLDNGKVEVQAASDPPGATRVVDARNLLPGGLIENVPTPGAVERLQGKVSGKAMEYPNDPAKQAAFDRLNLGDKDLDELYELRDNTPLDVHELEAVNNEITMLESDEDAEEPPAGEQQSQVDWMESRYDYPPDEPDEIVSEKARRSPTGEMVTAQAHLQAPEKSRVVPGKYSVYDFTLGGVARKEDGTLAYFGTRSEAERWRKAEIAAGRAGTPVTRVVGKRKVENLQEKVSEKKGGTVTLFGVGGGKFNVVQGTGRGGSRVKVIAYGVTREEAERVAKESGYRVQGRFL